MIESHIPHPAPVVTNTPHHITRRAVVSWVLYDLANTIFSLGILSLFFSLWVRDMVGPGRDNQVYGLITAVSMALIFVGSPLLGALTDQARSRMPFLVVSTLICVAFTALLGRAGFGITVLCFIVANVAYQAGLQFYDALLIEVSTEANRGTVGGIGVGIGYFGSYLAIGLGLIFGIDDKPLLFGLIALLFLLFAIPCFVFVKERGNPRPQRLTMALVRSSVRETIQTLRSGEQYPGLVRFLIGRILYTDAINTVVAIMALYTVNIAVSTGLTEEQGQAQANLILLAATTFAIVGGFFWGWLTDKRGPKWTLTAVLRAWIAIFISAALLGILGLPLWTLYVIASCAGFALGGVWAADRPYMLRLTPPARVGEFYGLYGMVGRFSNITGPIIWVLITYVTIQVFGLEPRVGQAIGVLVLLVLVIMSYVILRPVSDQPRVWQGTARAPDDAT